MESIFISACGMYQSLQDSGCGSRILRSTQASTPSPPAVCTAIDLCPCLWSGILLPLSLQPQWRVFFDNTVQCRTAECTEASWTTQHTSQNVLGSLLEPVANCIIKFLVAIEHTRPLGVYLSADCPHMGVEANMSSKAGPIWAQSKCRHQSLE